MEEVDSMVVEQSEEASNSSSSGRPPQNILLFYQFHPLSKDRDIVELYRSALENLCQKFHLQGRILVGCNEHQSEGINGNLSGSSSATEAFVQALTTTTHISCPTRKTDDDKSDKTDDPSDMETATMKILTEFWRECDHFYQKAGCKPLIMDPAEFKWSTCSESQLFPDLNIKITKELIGTGGVLAPIPLKDVHQGYLTPSEWHERMTQLQKNNKDDDSSSKDNMNSNDTVLIDCRNTKEWQIGHFPGAPDPATTTFNQFPRWVQQHSATLANKKVLMYCTGGIRCEKASAFIRDQIPSVQEVRHLKGGIHKYLDQYGSSEDCLWKGKNFVFDGRGAQAASTKTPPNESLSSSSTRKGEIVGTCLYCPTPYDVFEPGCVCTVCREPTLVCPKCRQGLREFHCHVHAHLRRCYFTDLVPYTKAELQAQLHELRELITEIAVGKKFKQKRKTLSKQCEKIAQRLAEIDGSDGDVSTRMLAVEQTELKCRNCGEAGCSGKCWGFHGLKRKRILDEMHRNHQSESGSVAVESSVSASASKKADLKKRNNLHLQQQKALDRKIAVDELVQLNLASSPSFDRNETTGIRIPATCTRMLQSKTKGKWCGKSLLSVLQGEFAELAQIDTLATILRRGLLRVNDRAITSLEEAESLKLKNMDVIGRVAHWHEPPVHLPRGDIAVHKIALPDRVQEAHDLQEDATIFVCDKPSTVPVHPAGPYLSNSLTMMVEAQEALVPKTLIPCHRIDRVTSGLTICCTNPKVAHLVQSRIDLGLVKKQYLAKVHGRFPGTPAEMKLESSTDLAKWNWSEEEAMLEVNAPVETVDPANGIRKITSQGKSARSLFRLIDHDQATDTSMVLCSPLTGRSHQLRVHLQWLGHSIVNDIQYGGTMDPSLDLSAGLLEANKCREEIRESNDVTLHPASVSEEDSKAATEICPFCTKGPKEAFSSSQLLQGGHQICLHALRYRIPFHAKKSGANTATSSSSDTNEPLGEVNLQVGLPPWAFGTEHLASMPWGSSS